MEFAALITGEALGGGGMYVPVGLLIIILVILFLIYG